MILELRQFVRITLLSLIAVLLVGAADLPAQDFDRSSLPDTIPCSFTNGLYRVHFTAYQNPDLIGGGSYLANYCENIPLTGEALLTLDLYRTYGGYIVRKEPVSVSVMEGDADGKGQQLVSLPSKAYPTGIIELKANFNKAGNHSVVVDFHGSKGKDVRVTIPLIVGMGTGELDGPALLKLLWILGSGLFLVYAINLLWRRSRESSIQTNDT